MVGFFKGIDLIEEPYRGMGAQAIRMNLNIPFVNGGISAPMKSGAAPVDINPRSPVSSPPV